MTPLYGPTYRNLASFHQEQIRGVIQTVHPDVLLFANLILKLPLVQ